MLFLTILTLPLAYAYFEECSCPALQMSTICPTSKCSEPLEANCSLSCPKDTTLYYKSGLPWQRAANISCDSGKYHADDREGFASLWHVTCAKPASCSNCAELMYTEFCPDGFVCENSLTEVQNAGCSRLSCREGDLMIIHENKTSTEVFTLQCAEGGVWKDVQERVHSNIPAVTCAMRRGCQTCIVPTQLVACRGDTDCFKGKLSLQASKIGNCRVATCDEKGFMIRTRSRFNESLITSSSNATNSTIVPPVIYDGVAELQCDEKGEWTIDTIQDSEQTTVNLGQDVEAVCYWPKCKRCVVEAMDCPPGEICSSDWLIEPVRTRECDVAECRNGTELIFRDSLGILRNVGSLRCNDEAEWEVVQTEEQVMKASKKPSLFDDEYVDGAEQLEEEKDAQTPPAPTQLHSNRAAITCKKIAPACQKCPDLKKSDICPGGVERGCNDIVNSGGATVNQCRVISCAADSVLWAYYEMRWNTLGSYLECAEGGEWKLPGGSAIPAHAEVACKYNGECHCTGSRLGTSSACESTWPGGCDYGAVDLFATAGECSKIECRYGGKLAIYKPNSKEFVRTIDGHLTCIGNGTYADGSGYKYTYLDSSVTCHSWTGQRHCARACTWGPANGDTTAFTESTNDQGCRQLRCKDSDKMEVHDTDNDKWITRKSLSCTQTGYWTSAEDRGAMIFPYKTVDKNDVEVRCV